MLIMEKIIPYLVGFIIAFFATIPVVNFSVPVLNDLWPWMVLVSGFFGFLTLFINTNLVVKIVAVGGFINCFLAFSPFLAFVSYFSLIAVCYFFILCTKIKDWSPVFKCLLAILFLNVLMLTMQGFGRDPINNFGMTYADYIVLIGQSMQTASMFVVLSAFLISCSRLNLIFSLLASVICLSVWGVACGFAGWLSIAFNESKKKALIILAVAGIVFVAFGVSQHKFERNLSNLGRAGVWAKAIELANQRPLTGWGIGSFKYIFPIKSNMPTSFPWKTAHNFFIQLYFEAGFLSIVLAVTGIAILLSKLIGLGLINCVAGLVMIIANSLVHFPDRQIQTVLILVAFVAYCIFMIKERNHGCQ